MNYVNILFKCLGPAISIYIMMLAFGILDNNRKLKLDIKNVVVIMFCGVILSLNTYNNDSLPQIIVSVVVTIACSMILYKENILKSFIYTIILFIFSMFYEIVFSCIVYLSNIIDAESFNHLVIIKTFFSLLIAGLLYYTCKIKIINSFANKIIHYLNKIKHISLFLLAILLFLIILDYNGLNYFKIDAYINNIMLLSSISLIIVFGLYNYIKANKEVEKTETLLNFLKRYEKIIDNDRENRHEMLNNLLILKSVDDKNTKEYDEILNDLITNYNNKGIGIKNIYKLPSGLKGIFYYRLSSLSDKGMNINVNISKQFNLSEKCLSHANYISLCRIIGIALDNAIEASISSNKKMINIDAHKEKRNYVICIDNTFDKKVDINKINNKNYSTKGRGRGLGLYLAKNLLKDNDKIIMEQKIDSDIFMTKIIVKEKTSN